MEPTAVDEPPAAPVGVLLAGVALVAAVLVAQRGVVTALPLAAVGVVVAVVALGGFVARRLRLASRRLGASLALAGSIAVLGYAGYVLVRGDFDPVVGGISAAAVGGGLGVVAGLGGVLAAAVDVAAVPRGRFWRVATTTAKYLGIGMLGVLVQIPVFFIIGFPLSFAVGGLSENAVTAVGTVSGGLGMLAVVALYLRESDRDWSFIDVERPSLRDAGYAVGGVLAIFGAAILVNVVKTLVGAESAEHGVVQQAADGNPEILLVLVPLSWLVIGPGEELLYRNVVQKGLYDYFSRYSALVVASVIFAAAHFQAYYSTDPLAFLSSLTTIFVLSLVLGAIYIRTDNIVVPAFVHGTFNAIQFAALYATLTAETGSETAAAAAMLLV